MTKSAKPSNWVIKKREDALWAVPEGSVAGQGNYVVKLEKLCKEHPELFPHGKVTHPMIYHDSTCAVYKKLPCDCDPDIEVLTDEEFKQKHGSG